MRVDGDCAVSLFTRSRYSVTYCLRHATAEQTNKRERAKAGVEDGDMERGGDMRGVLIHTPTQRHAIYVVFTFTNELNVSEGIGSIYKLIHKKYNDGYKRRDYQLEP